jgi:nucleoside-diphosphate-sugar epimerase
MGAVSSRHVLITGAGGFVARHLMAQIQRDPACQITGVSLKPEAQYEVCDLGNRPGVTRLLANFRPVRIYHCAGTFSNNWDIDLAANVSTSRNIFEAIIELKLSCRVLLMGSAAEYGWPPAGPVPETAPLKPVSIYGLTKSWQTQLMHYYHRKHGLDIVMARTFNLFGEGCSPALFPGRVLEQVQKIQAGHATRIKVGSLDSKRDYLSIEQAVGAYVKIMARGQSGEIYNVGSGVPVKLSDFLAAYLKQFGLTMDVVDVAAPTGGEQKSEVTEIYADISKLQALN